MSSRYPHLPPLHALLVFEAAAYHESFAKAAEELCLTASAVAHQVKKLEASLGVTLFIRHSRGVSLSPHSRSFFHKVQQSLQDLHQHTEQVKDFSTQAIRVSTQHAIAQLWLQLRLGEYQDQFSERELEIIARSRIEDSPTDADITIAYFAESPTDPAWQSLWEETLLPVCHPEYRQAEPVLYLDAHWADDWDAWKNGAKPDFGAKLNSGFSRIRRSSLYVLVLQSVLEQRGIMIARQSLLQGYLDRGDLIAWPEPNTAPVSHGAYYLHPSPVSLNNPYSNDFRAWLVQKVRAEQKYQSC